MTLLKKGNDLSNSHNYTEALECYERSVWLGGPSDAAKNAGIILSSPETGCCDYKEGFFYLLHAAKLGNKTAMYIVASFYDKEMRELKNTSYPPANAYTSNVWAQKAISAGEIQCCAKYAKHLALGIGCEKNMEMARVYAEKGALAGDAQSMYILA